MKVSELFETEKVTLDMLEVVSEESEYWDKAAGFVAENWDRDLDGMSMKQSAWMTGILDDIVEKRIRGGFR